MDIDEEKIGEWPNVALEPGTRRHAATGERVEQPWWTKVEIDPADMPLELFFRHVEREARKR